MFTNGNIDFRVTRALQRGTHATFCQHIFQLNVEPYPSLCGAMRCSRFYRENMARLRYGYNRNGAILAYIIQCIPIPAVQTF